MMTCTTFKHLLLVWEKVSKFEVCGFTLNYPSFWLILKCLFYIFHFRPWLIPPCLCYMSYSHGWEVKFLCVYCKSSNWCCNSFAHEAVFGALCCIASGTLDYYLRRIFFMETFFFVHHWEEWWVSFELTIYHFTLAITYLHCTQLVHLRIECWMFVIDHQDLDL